MTFATFQTERGSKRLVGVAQKQIREVWQKKVGSFFSLWNKDRNCRDRRADYKGEESRWDRNGGDKRKGVALTTCRMIKSPKSEGKSKRKEQEGPDDKKVRPRFDRKIYKNVRFFCKGRIAFKCLRDHSPSSSMGDSYFFKRPFSHVFYHQRGGF